MTINRLLLYLGLLLQLHQISAQFPPCSICRASETLLNGDVVIPADTAGLLNEDATCAQVEAMANGGDFSPAVCSLLGLIVSERCGCQAVVAPTDNPGVSETPAPVPSSTEVPVAAPTELPVLTTTQAPVVVPVETETPVAANTATEAPSNSVAVTPAPGVTTTEAPVVVSPPSSDAPSTATPVTQTPVGTTVVPATEAPVILSAPSSSPVSSAPIPAPSSTTIPATDAPSTVVPVTQAPVATTEGPSIVSAPSSNLDAKLFVRLLGFSNAELPDTNSFEQACTTFLSEKIKDVSAWGCVVADSRPTARKLRALQSSSLAVELDISGQSQSLSGEEFFNAVFQALNEDSNLFLATLKGANSDYETIQSIEVSSSSFAASPTDATKGSKKLASGVVASIVVGVVAAVILIGVIILILCKSRNAKRPYPEVQESPKHNTGVVNSPLETTGNKEAHAPAAASMDKAASVGSESGISGSESVENQSYHKSASSTVAGESEMETFSVAAGNVEETVAKSGAAGDTSASGDELSSHAMSSLRQTMISRTIVAPPGKLGIVIDTTLEGPIVFKINPQSPLEGSLFPGDIIVAIDDVDTRAMSASAITALMVRTANLRRTLTVLSEDTNN